MSASDQFAPITPETWLAFQAHRQEIIRAVVVRSLARKDEVAQHGDHAERLLAAGLEFTTQMLETVMQLGDPSALHFQLEWARDRLPHDGVQPRHVLARLQIYRSVVAEFLPVAHAAAVNRFVDWMIARQQDLMGSA